MKLSFLPAELFLTLEDTEYVVTLAGEELIRTTIERNALRKFNILRKELEEKYPARELTKEEKQEALKRLIGDRVYTEVRNSMKVPKKDKMPKTRTWG